VPPLLDTAAVYSLTVLPSIMCSS